MAPRSLGELVCGPEHAKDHGVAKAQVAAKFAGLSLEAKSDSAAGHAVELKTPEGSLQGENAVARYIAVAAEASLYPACPFEEQSRHSAAQVDSWVEFSANEIQRRLQLLFAAPSQEAASAEEVRLAKSLSVLEQRLQSCTYLVDDALSLADVVVVCDLAPAFSKVLDKSVRDRIPNTVRWFTTLAQHQHFASALGPVSLAAKPYAAAGASTAEPAGSSSSSSSSKREGSSRKQKEGKKGKDGKQKALLSNGGGPGDHQGKKKESKMGMSTKKTEDFGKWYSELVVAAELISYYDVSGCYILRPSAFFIWEAITAFFDAEIKKLGVQNASFPLFVTEKALNTEKDHVEGFAAEVAWVTKAGQSDLERPIAIRPTSETVMYPYFAEWIRSHRDLPLRLNQWTNVVRWEFKHPTPFIRTREFLWQEGHTAFASRAEAEEEVYQILDLYARVYTDLLAVPVKKGRKSELEKFAGALFTTSVEGFVPETGRGVQGGTSHCLGQNFSKMFGIEFETAADRTASSGDVKEGTAQKEFAWQNSWGLSTRTIGVMLMVHSDDKGLVMPPRVAPRQVVVIPIPASTLTDAQRQELAAMTQKVVEGLRGAGLRVHLDDRVNQKPGWKYNEWELKGVPLRVELGMRDVEKQCVMTARRDTGAKDTIPFADVAARVPALLEQIQADMFQRASANFEECTETATTWGDFMAALDRKHMVMAPWADEAAIEKQVRKESASEDAMGAKTLCIPLQQPPLPEGARCFMSGKPAKNWALWGRSY